MLTAITIISLPLLIWLWLGVTFTIARYAFIVAYYGDENMTDTRPAKIIRYDRVTNYSKPGLLSFYDEEKNIQTIDRERAELLPVQMRHRLEMSELPFTRLTPDGLRFVPYDKPEKKENIPIENGNVFSA